jgi:hypothetical protein
MESPSIHSSHTQQQPSSQTSPTLPPATGWIDIINESVHTRDDIDVGDIEAVNKNFVVVKSGFINVHYYYIPITKIEGWDGRVLWLTLTEQEVKQKYERDPLPDPARYYVKDAPSQYSHVLDGPTIIIPRWTKAVYTTAISGEQPRVHKCDLCNISFQTEDELSMHIDSHH